MRKMKNKTTKDEGWWKFWAETGLDYNFRSYIYHTFLESDQVEEIYEHSHLSTEYLKKLYEKHYQIDSTIAENPRAYFEKTKRKKKMNQVIYNSEQAMLDITNTQKMAKQLMQSGHYKKLGEPGIFAIVQKAQSLGINPLEALNGGMYYVDGKVEMQAIMMAKLIRKAGHSITMGKESDSQKCVLHGKRKDNGDTWKVSFSIEDAQRAGIIKAAWRNYPEDMLYSRALSRLARQLFPDVISNCYVEGEIRDSVGFNGASDAIESTDAKQIEVKVDFTDQQFPSAQEVTEITELLKQDPKYYSEIMNWISKRYEASSLMEVPYEKFKEIYERIQNRVNMQIEEIQEGEDD